MGFSDAKRLFLDAIGAGRVHHETRTTQADKNWLASGRIAADEACAILEWTRGGNASQTPHHFDPEVEVWVFRPTFQGERWYIKGYLVGTELRLVELRLISFHPSEGRE